MERDNNNFTLNAKSLHERNEKNKLSLRKKEYFNKFMLKRTTIDSLEVNKIENQRKKDSISIGKFNDVFINGTKEQKMELISNEHLTIRTLNGDVINIYSEVVIKAIINELYNHKSIDEDFLNCALKVVLLCSKYASEEELEIICNDNKLAEYLFKVLLVKYTTNDDILHTILLIFGNITLTNIELFKDEYLTILVKLFEDNLNKFKIEITNNLIWLFRIYSFDDHTSKPLISKTANAINSFIKEEIIFTHSDDMHIVPELISNILEFYLSLTFILDDDLKESNPSLYNIVSCGEFFLNFLKLFQYLFVSVPIILSLEQVHVAISVLINFYSSTIDESVLFSSLPLQITEQLIIRHKNCTKQEMDINLCLIRLINQFVQGFESEKVKHFITSSKIIPVIFKSYIKNPSLHEGVLELVIEMLNRDNKEYFVVLINNQLIKVVIEEIKVLDSSSMTNNNIKHKYLMILLKIYASARQYEISNIENVLLNEMDSIKFRLEQLSIDLNKDVANLAREGLYHLKEKGNLE